jgi:uncharacterized protein (DUF1778 family)
MGAADNMKKDKHPRAAIEQTDVIRLSIEGQRQIAAAILSPPAPTKALKKAAKRYRELFGANY